MCTHTHTHTTCQPQLDFQTLNDSKLNKHVFEADGYSCICELVMHFPIVSVCFSLSVPMCVPACMVSVRKKKSLFAERGERNESMC